MDAPQNMAMDHLENLRFQVVVTLFVLMLLMGALMVRKEELFIKFVKGMDNGLLTFLIVVIVNY